jgi:hypothetical protein
MRPVKIHYDAGQQKTVDRKLVSNMMAIIVLRHNNRYLNMLKTLNNLRKGRKQGGKRRKIFP